MLFTCKLCKKDKPIEEESTTYIGMCNSCVSTGKEVLNLSVDTSDWTKLADINDIELYDRQPMEADTEWRLFQCYSAMYPEAKPSLRQAAELAGISYSHASSIATKWDYKLRIQAYKQWIDELSKAQRAIAVKDMNAKHVSMAMKLQGKLDRAIDNIDPTMLAPRDINALLKTMSELERKALLDNAAQEAIEYRPAVGSSSEGKKEVTLKKNDMTEILGILKATGQLNTSLMGVETTTTTRVIAKGE